jgi:hypothetical protein
VIERILHSVGRARLARTPTLVSPIDGATVARAAELEPGIARMVGAFARTPLMRMSEVEFRSWRFDAGSRPFLPKDALGIRIARLKEDDGMGRASNGLDELFGQHDHGRDCVNVTHAVGKETAGIAVDGMPDMLWGMMSRRMLSQNAGVMAALVLGVVRSFIDGRAVVAHADALDCSRVMRLHHLMSTGRIDTQTSRMIGKPRDFGEFHSVWSLRISGNRVVIRPIIADADAETFDPVSTIRMTQVEDRIAKQAGSLGIVPWGPLP